MFHAQIKLILYYDTSYTGKIMAKNMLKCLGNEILSNSLSIALGRCRLLLTSRPGYLSVIF